MEIFKLQNVLCRLHKEAINSNILRSLELELVEEFGIIRQHLGFNRILFRKKDEEKI
jgi:hypothetical protein